MANKPIEFDASQPFDVADVPNKGEVTFNESQPYEVADTTPAVASVSNTAPVVTSDIPPAIDMALKFGSKVGKSFSEASQYGFPGMVARNALYYTGQAHDLLRQKFPGKSDEWYNEHAWDLITQTQKDRRAANQDEHKPLWDPEKGQSWLDADVGDTVAYLLGQVGGSAGPESVFMPGGSVLARMAGQAALGAGSDAVYQGADIHDNVSSEYNPMETLAAGAAGAGFQGALEGLRGSIYGLRDFMSGEKAPDAPSEAPKAPDEAPKAPDAPVGKDYTAVSKKIAEMVQDGTPDDDIRAFVSNEGDGRNFNVEAVLAHRAKNGAYTPDLVETNKTDPKTYPQIDVGEPKFDTNRPYTVEEMKTADGLNEDVRAFKEAKASKAEPDAESLFAPKQKATVKQFESGLQKAADEFLVGRKSDEPTVPVDETVAKTVSGADAPVSKEEPSGVSDEHHAAVQQAVNDVSKSWKNAPNVEVLKSLDDIQDPAIRAQAEKEGASDALGFVGPDGKVRILAKNITDPADVPSVVFHESLGHYGLSQKFGKGLDDLLGKLYKGNIGDFKDKVDTWIAENPEAYKGDKQHIRAAEEVLAENSEGGALSPKLKDVVANYVKGVARKMGIDLAYSDREINTILGMAHDAVVKGKTTAADNGFRYSKKWHGSPHDFEKFDHSKMGSGEGAQVFGWGTYLTDSKTIAEGYRDRLQIPENKYRGKEYKGHEAGQALIDDVSNDFFALHPEHEATPSLVRSRIRKVVEGELKATPDSLAGPLGKPNKEGKYPQVFHDLADFINDARVSPSSKKGKLYEVHVPDDAQFLNLDKPIGQQREIRQKLKDAGYELMSSDDYGYLERRVTDAKIQVDSLTKDFAYAKNRKAEGDPAYQNLDSYPKAISAATDKVFSADAELSKVIRDTWNGKAVYTKLSDDFGSDKAASLFLHENGVKGNKYLTGLDRAKGEGEHNYVIFDDKTPEIVNKFMRKKKNGTETEVIGNINVERLSTVNDIDGVLKKLADENPVKEGVTWDETKQAARDLNLNPSKVAKGKGVGELSAKITAYRQVQANLLDEVAGLNKQMEEGEYSPGLHARALEQFAKLTAVHARVSNDTGELGRALNALKILSTSSKKSAEILKLFKESGGNAAALADPVTFMKFMKSVQQMLNGGNPQGAAVLMTKVFKPYWEDYIIAGRHVAMLSSLSTHYKNVIDNFNMIGREFTEAGLATLGGKVTPQEMAGRAYGLVRAALDSETYARTIEAFKKGHENQTVNSKIEIEGAKIPFAGKVLDALHAEDTFFRSFMDASNLYALGMRRAKEEGFKGKALFAQGSHYALNPNPMMLEEARHMADVALVVSEPTKIVRAIEVAKARTPEMNVGDRTARFAAHIVFPFARVADRILFQRIRRSPLGLLDGETRADIAAGGARRHVAISRMLYGSAIIGYYVMQANKGNVEGSGPENLAKVKALQAGGYLPNSVKSDDSYTDATSVNTALNPFNLSNTLATDVATLVEGYKKHEISGEDYLSGIGRAIKSVAGVMTSGSFADSLKPYSDAIHESGSASTKAARVASSVATSFIPNAVKVANASLIDPVKHDTTGDKSFLGRVEGSIQGATPTIPGLTKGSKALPLAYDVYGRPMPTGRNISGVNNSQKIDKDPTVVELQRLERTTDSAVVTAPKDSFSIEGAKIKLTGHDYAEYQRIAGSLFLEQMQKIAKLPTWRGISDSTKIKAIKELLTRTRKEAQEKLVETGVITKEKITNLSELLGEKEGETPTNVAQQADFTKSETVASALQDDLGLIVTDSGTRSHAEQEYYYRTFPGVAKPGTSSHEHDKAVDVRASDQYSPSDIQRYLESKGLKDVRIVTKRHGTAPHWHIQWA